MVVPDPSYDPYIQLAEQCVVGKTLYQNMSKLETDLDDLEAKINRESNGEFFAVDCDDDDEFLKQKFVQHSDADLQTQLKRQRDLWNGKAKLCPSAKDNRNLHKLQICRILKEMKRREEASAKTLQERSTAWKELAFKNQAEAKSVHPEAQTMSIAHDEEENDDVHFQGPRAKAKPAMCSKDTRGSRSVGNILRGHGQSLPSSRHRSRSNSPQRGRQTGRQLPFPMTMNTRQKMLDRIACFSCHVEFGEDEVRKSQVKGAAPADMICKICWEMLLPNIPFPSQADGRGGLLETRNITVPAVIAKGPGGKLVETMRGRVQPAAAQAASRPPRGRGSVYTRKKAASGGQTKETAVELLSSEDEDSGVGRSTLGNIPPPRRSARDHHITLGEMMKGHRALYPPGGGKDAVEVCGDDLTRLDDMEFLNDTCIDFYIRWLKHKLEQPQEDGGQRGADILKRVHFFNSFFYKKLTEAASEKANFPHVKKWTKHVDIFSKDFLFVPIHDALHWSLAIICYPGNNLDEDPSQIPCILHLDSMAGGHLTNPVCKNLLTYLQLEWEDKVASGSGRPAVWQSQHGGERREFNDHTVATNRVRNVPKQDNHCDCGVFLLTYLEFFVDELPSSIEAASKSKNNGRPDVDVTGITRRAENPAYLTKSWFDPANPAKLRGFIRAEMLNMFAQQSPPDEPSVNEAYKRWQEYKDETPERRYLPPKEYQEYFRRKTEKENEEKRQKAEADQERKRQKEEEKQRKKEEKQRAQAEEGIKITLDDDEEHAAHQGSLVDYRDDGEDDEDNQVPLRKEPCAPRATEDDNNLSFNRASSGRGGEPVASSTAANGSFSNWMSKSFQCSPLRGKLDWSSKFSMSFNFRSLSADFSWRSAHPPAAGRGRGRVLDDDGDDEGGEAPGATANGDDVGRGGVVHVVEENDGDPLNPGDAAPTTAPADAQDGVGFADDPNCLELEGPKTQDSGVISSDSDGDGDASSSYQVPETVAGDIDLGAALSQGAVVASVHIPKSPAGPSGSPEVLFQQKDGKTVRSRPFDSVSAAIRYQQQVMPVLEAVVADCVKGKRRLGPPPVHEFCHSSFNLGRKAPRSDHSAGPRGASSAQVEDLTQEEDDVAGGPSRKPIGATATAQLLHPEDDACAAQDQHDRPAANHLTAHDNHMVDRTARYSRRGVGNLADSAECLSPPVPLDRLASKLSPRAEPFIDGHGGAAVGLMSDGFFLPGELPGVHEGQQVEARADALACDRAGNSPMGSLNLDLQFEGSGDGDQRNGSDAAGGAEETGTSVANTAPPGNPPSHASCPARQPVGATAPATYKRNRGKHASSRKGGLQLVPTAVPNGGVGSAGGDGAVPLQGGVSGRCAEGEREGEAAEVRDLTSGLDQIDLTDDAPKPADPYDYPASQGNADIGDTGHAPGGDKALGESSSDGEHSGDKAPCTQQTVSPLTSPEGHRKNKKRKKKRGGNMGRKKQDHKWR